MQEQVQKQTRPVEEAVADTTTTGATNAELAESTEGALASIDDALADQDELDFLAEMDDVLEEDAEAFVRGFIQKGGE